MKTVAQISRLTGVSIRALHHYHEIGLLQPAQVTEAGYRLYDDAAVERLYLIVLYRELGFSLKDIDRILNGSDFDRSRVLEQQIALLEEKQQHIQNCITLARGLQTTGGAAMSFEKFDAKKIHERSEQARTLWGHTDAYREYEQKSRNRTDAQQKNLGDGLMALFTRLSELRQEQADSAPVQAWVQTLRDYITAHYYTCTPEILRGLGEMYAGGGSMTDNIDAAGGPGTGAFARAAIRVYCSGKK